MKFERYFVDESKQEMTNGASWSLNKCWECAIHQYGLPFLQYFISVVYEIYTSCNVVNVALFLVKIVPTGMYVTHLVRNIYVTSRERLRQNQIEIEDLQLQIQILNTKLSVRDAEFMERAEELRKGIERFRKVRARIREVIATDDGLRHSLHEAITWEEIADAQRNSTHEEREFILQLLKELKNEQEEAGEGTEPTEKNCGKRASSEPFARAASEEDSVYSSASDTDAKQNCRVKIVKVTNVFKVAYLKHYMKQKKLRQATKHATLKKKVETVKQFLEDWQKTLDMVINSRISILNVDHKYSDSVSQSAMGDYANQDLREFCDTDSDNRNFNDNYYEQPILSWAQNTERNFTSSFEDVPDTAVCKEIREPHFGKYAYKSECSPRSPNILFNLPEETNSQLAIQEVRSEGSDEYECRDVVSI